MEVKDAQSVFFFFKKIVVHKGRNPLTKPFLPTQTVIILSVRERKSKHIGRTFTMKKIGNYYIVSEIEMDEIRYKLDWYYKYKVMAEIDWEELEHEQAVETAL